MSTIGGAAAALPSATSWRSGTSVDSATSYLPRPALFVFPCFAQLKEPCAVALEAAWNWGVLYNWLERIESVKEIQGKAERRAWGFSSLREFVPCCSVSWDAPIRSGRSAMVFNSDSNIWGLFLKR